MLVNRDFYFPKLMIRRGNSDIGIRFIPVEYALLFVAIRSPAGFAFYPGDSYGDEFRVQENSRICVILRITKGCLRVKIVWFQFFIV